MSGFTVFIGGGVTALTHVANATGSNAGQVAVPGSAQAGDLGIMFDWAVGGTIAGGTPSGWTLATSAAGTGGSALICYKVLVGGDVGATVTGLHTATIRRQTISVFRPDDDIDSVAVGSGAAFSGSTAPGIQTVSASGQSTPLLVVAQQGATGTIDMASFPSFGGTLDNPATDQRVGYSIYNTNPSDHTITSSTTGSNILLSRYIRVS